MHTAEQAKELWCPMVRMSYVRHESCNRVGTSMSPRECRCISSDCAMWRWKDPLMACIEQSTGTVKWQQVREDDAQGYCGLAGRP